MDDVFSLKGKVAVITGAASGIGNAIMQVFARQGAEIIAVDLQEDLLREEVEHIRLRGGSITMQKLDITDHSAVTAFFDNINRVSILINAAGIAHVGNAMDTQVADFERVMRVNVHGTFHMIQAALPLLTQQPASAIVNIASVAALVGIADRFAYSTSKGAIYAMTKSVAKDYLKQGVRCNSISPARIHTPFVDGFLAKHYPGQEEEMFRKLSASQPIGRMGTVWEVAALVLYLCADEAAFVTGCDYPIDGGFTTLNN
jgi:2-keto-3-deoxy-L-fuconate dehydrogenase